MREVVAYAARRHVTIVPEIEMPGHAVEVLAAYPQFGCGHGPYATRQLCGVSTEILCPTERLRLRRRRAGRGRGAVPRPVRARRQRRVPKTVWRASPVVAALMQREHLATYDAVQGYFTRRVEALARSTANGSSAGTDRRRRRDARRGRDGLARSPRSRTRR